jgi:hypothetical protein
VSCHCDVTSAKFLNKFGSVFAPSLANQYFLKGTFPDSLKVSQVISVFKIGLIRLTIGNVCVICYVEIFLKRLLGHLKRTFILIRANLVYEVLQKIFEKKYFYQLITDLQSVYCTSRCSIQAKTRLYFASK